MAWSVGITWVGERLPPALDDGDRDLARRPRIREGELTSSVVPTTGAVPVISSVAASALISGVADLHGDTGRQRDTVRRD